MSEDAATDRILTVPNVLSVVRLCLIPVFAWLLLGRDNRAGAALLLAGLASTDWVDGYVARRFNQVSNLGKVLDPTADRLLLGVAAVCILLDGSVPAVIAWPVLAREAFVASGVLIVAAMGGRRIDVSWAGKAATFALMASFPLFLLANDRAFPLRDAAELAAWIAALVGLVLGYYAAARYVPVALVALREGRSVRGRPASG